MKSARVTAPRTAALAFAVLGFALVASSSASGQTFAVLYSFAGYPTDGAGPGAGLLMGELPTFIFVNVDPSLLV